MPTPSAQHLKMLYFYLSFACRFIDTYLIAISMMIGVEPMLNIFSWKLVENKLKIDCPLFKFFRSITDLQKKRKQILVHTKNHQNFVISFQYWRFFCLWVNFMPINNTGGLFFINLDLFEGKKCRYFKRVSTKWI